MNLEDAKDLLPDAFDKSEGSNISLLFEVIVEVFQEIVDVFQQLRDLEDINNVFGATLDLMGKDYKVNRDGMTDDQFRSVILAKQYNFNSGNDVNKILSYFNLFANDVHMVELFEPELGYFLDGVLNLDGTWLLSGADQRRFRAFDVQSADISIDLENSLRIALDFLKAAGIKATINQTTSFPDYGQYNYGQGYYGE